MGLTAVDGKTTPNLVDFYAFAQQAENPDAAIKIGHFSGKLKIATLPTTRTTNLEMRDNFLTAVRDQLGDTAAEQVERLLDTPGKPLTACKIRTSLETVQQQMTQDLVARTDRQQQIARTERQANDTKVIDAELDAFLDQVPKLDEKGKPVAGSHLCANWSPSMRDLFKRVVVAGMSATCPEGADLKAHFRTALERGGFAERLIRHTRGCDSNHLLLALFNVKPTEIDGVLRAHELFGCTTDQTVMSLIQAHAPELAACSSRGELTLDAAWGILFKDAPLSDDDRSAVEAAAFSPVAAFRDQLEDQGACPSPDTPPEAYVAWTMKAQNVALFSQSRSEGLEIMKGTRPLEFADSPQMRTMLMVGTLTTSSGLPQAQRQLLNDINRVAPVVRLTGGTMPGGLVWDFTGREGDVEPMVNDLAAQIKDLCGAEHEQQIINVFLTLTQNCQLIDSLSQAGDSTKGIEPWTQPKSTGFGVWISKEADGSVLVTRRQGPESNVVADLTFRFSPDGRQELVECSPCFKLTNERSDASTLKPEEFTRAKLTELRNRRTEMAPQAFLEGVAEAVQNDPRLPDDVKANVRQRMNLAQECLKSPVAGQLGRGVDQLLAGITDPALRATYTDRLFPKLEISFPPPGDRRPAWDAGIHQFA